jgi:hypothetical protein
MDVSDCVSQPRGVPFGHNFVEFVVAFRKRDWGELYG